MTAEEVSPGRFDDLRNRTKEMPRKGLLEHKHVADALCESEGLLKLITDNMSDMIRLTDQQGNILYVSPSHLTVLGYKPEERLGKSTFDFVHPDDIENVFKVFSEGVAKTQPAKVECRVKHANGHYVWLEIVGDFLRNGKGEVTAVVMTARDITERKRLEEELKQQRDHFAQMVRERTVELHTMNDQLHQEIAERKQAEAYREMGREALQILNEPGDLQDSVKRVLAALKTRTGFDAVGIRLQDGDDFPYFVQKGFSKDFLLTENTLIERAADGGVCRDKDGNVRLECTCGLVISGKTDPAHPLFTPGGSFWTNDSFPLLDLPSDQDPRLHPRNQCIHHGYATMALVPIRNKDRIVGLIHLNDRRKGRFTLEMVELLEGIASHIGASLMRKQAEEAIRALNEELQARLRELIEAKALEAEANRAKSEFLANISHELTTPLNSIIGFPRVLLTKISGDLNEKQQGYVENILNSGERLHETLKNIISFVQMDVSNPDMDWEDFRMKDIVNSSLSVFRKAATDRHFTLTLDMEKEADRLIRADRGKLVQVFHNLLSNAVKFSREGGQITLRVRYRKGSEESGKDDFMEVTVEDTGIGIKEEDLPRLFRPFEQLEALLTKQFAGAGMGLVMAQKLIEAHGGAIRVESDYGKGSKFIFTIPVKERHEK